MAQPLQTGAEKMIMVDSGMSNGDLSNEQKK